AGAGGVAGGGGGAGAGAARSPRFGRAAGAGPWSPVGCCAVGAGRRPRSGRSRCWSAPGAACGVGVGAGAGAGAGAVTGAEGLRRSGWATTVGGIVREGGSPSRAGRKTGAGACPWASGAAGRTYGRTYTFGVFVRIVRIVALSSGRPGLARSACS